MPEGQLKYVREKAKLLIKASSCLYPLHIFWSSCVASIWKRKMYKNRTQSPFVGLNETSTRKIKEIASSDLIILHKLSLSTVNKLHKGNSWQSFLLQFLTFLVGTSRSRADHSVLLYNHGIVYATYLRSYSCNLDFFYNTVNWIIILYFRIKETLLVMRSSLLV